jgi:thymidylate kinase
VRAGDLALARAHAQRFRVIDAALPLEAVERRVGEILTELLARGAAA